MRVGWVVACLLGLSIQTIRALNLTDPTPGSALFSNTTDLFEWQLDNPADANDGGWLHILLVSDASASDVVATLKEWEPISFMRDLIHIPTNLSGQYYIMLNVTSSKENSQISGPYIILTETSIPLTPQSSFFSSRPTFDIELIVILFVVVILCLILFIFHYKRIKRFATFVIKAWGGRRANPLTAMKSDQFSQEGVPSVEITQESMLSSQGGLVYGAPVVPPSVYIAGGHDPVAESSGTNQPQHPVASDITLSASDRQTVQMPFPNPPANQHTAETEDCPATQDTVQAESIKSDTGTELSLPISAESASLVQSPRRNDDHELQIIVVDDNEQNSHSHAHV